MRQKETLEQLELGVSWIIIVLKEKLITTTIAVTDPQMKENLLRNLYKLYSTDLNYFDLAEGWEISENGSKSDTESEGMP